MSDTTLLSWNDTPTRAAITSFVERVSAPGPGFVPVEERVAVFDNDGTLWSEQPMYFQLAFVVDRVKALAARHPEWKTQEPFASLLKGDVAAAWGDQMRNYVLNPYQMVKDLRTGYEVGNPQSVFDGDLDGFIEAGIRWRRGAERAAQN